MAGNHSTGVEEKINEKMDEIGIKPTSIVTRREYTRNILSKKIADDMKKKLAPEPMNNEKNLQGSKIVHESGREHYPLNGGGGGDASKELSFWSEHAHPIRGFRRSYDFTKPDCEYLGTSKWR